MVANTSQFRSSFDSSISGLREMKLYSRADGPCCASNDLFQPDISTETSHIKSWIVTTWSSLVSHDAFQKLQKWKPKRHENCHHSTFQYTNPHSSSRRPSRMRHSYLFQAQFVLLLLLGAIHSMLAAASPRATPHVRSPISSALMIPVLQRSQQPKNLLQPRYYRHYNHLPLGWNLYYTTFTQILPSQHLVNYLSAVYQSVMTNTMNSLSKSPERNIVTLNIGYLQMDFRCETRTIPWPFIFSFAKMAQAMLNRGFYGFYGVMLSHAQAGQVVYVTLRLNPALLGGRAARRPLHVGG